MSNYFDMVHVICAKILLRKIKENEKLYKDDFKVMEIILNNYIKGSLNHDFKK